MKQYVLGGALFLALAGSPQEALADGGTAEVTRTSWYGLYVDSIESVTSSNLKLLDHDAYGKPAGSITYADLDFNVTVLPNGCDVTYSKGEIIAKTSSSDDAYSVTDPKIEVEFGTIETIGMGQACVGLPPRKAHLKLEFVNGIGAYFDNDRVYTYQFKGPNNRVTENPELWLVKVKVNQAKAKIEVVSIERKNDAPVIPAAFTETLKCNTSDKFIKDPNLYPADDSLELTLTKTAGDAKDSKNYRLVATGVAKSIFGVNAGRQSIQFSPGTKNKPTWIAKDALYLDAESSATSVLGVTFDSVEKLGWKSNQTLILSLIDRDRGRLLMCRITDVVVGPGTPPLN